MKTVCRVCGEEKEGAIAGLCDECAKVYTSYINYTDVDLLGIRWQCSDLIKKCEREKSAIEDFLNCKKEGMNKGERMVGGTIFAWLFHLFWIWIWLQTIPEYRSMVLLVCIVTGLIALSLTIGFIYYGYKPQGDLTYYEKELKELKIPIEERGRLSAQQVLQEELGLREDNIKYFQKRISEIESLQQARNLEKAMRLEDAAQIYEKLGYYDKAGELRRKEVKKYDRSGSIL